MAPPTGTVMFQFTDVEGSTRLWQDHPDQTRPALARHDQLLRRVTGAGAVQVCEPVGDALFFAFPTAPDALAAAFDAGRAMTREQAVGCALAGEDDHESH